MNTSKQTVTHLSFVGNIALKNTGLILFSLVLFTGINAQSIFHRQGVENKTITIDTTTVSPVPTPVMISNGSSVKVTGNKLPVNICTVAYKREELKPEPNPFASFLSILVKSVAGGGTELAELPCPKVPESAVPSDAEAKQIMGQLKNIEFALGVNYDALNRSGDRHGRLLARAKALMNCEGGVCSDSDFDTIKTDIDNELVSLVPILQTTELQLSTLLKIVAERYKKVTPPEESERESRFIGLVNRRLDCYTSFLDSLKQTRETIIAARVDLKKFLDAAAQLKIANGADGTHYRRELPKDNNAKITGTVTCVNFFSKQVSVEAIPFSVTYQNIPIATVSAGALFSSLGKRQIAVQPVKTGTDINGIATFKNVFAEIDKASFQIIPFSFLNFYISGTRKMNLNFSTGIGVSSTNGKAQIEYFAGPSISFKNLFFHAGAHYGRRQELSGGFVIGETVPANFPSSLPIDRRYVAKFAFGISYKIP